MLAPLSDINYINPSNGSSALRIAIMDADLRLLRYLASNKFDLEVNNVDKNLNTPLTNAILYNLNIIFIKILIDKGANINVYNKTKNYSPLSMAIHYRKKTLIRELYKNDPEIFNKDKIYENMSEIDKEYAMSLNLI